ncbi:MAG: hypothetical protein KGJ78_00240 [Alphaproteobacteria bacterium]|nr:hypothetical protein [Alphaproteobacteria bacterium]
MHGETLRRINLHSLRRLLPTAVVLTSVLALSGCGTDPSDRMLSGAMIGAAGGAIIGAATGTAATGAAIGAVSGAVIGGVTDPCQLDLGAPYWRRHGGRAAYHRRCGPRDEDR